MAAVLSGVPAAAEGTWTTKAPMPDRRAEPVVGVIDGKIYVAGG